MKPLTPFVLLSCFLATLAHAETSNPDGLRFLDAESIIAYGTRFSSLNEAYESLLSAAQGFGGSELAELNPLGVDQDGLLKELLPLIEREFAWGLSVQAIDSVMALAQLPPDRMIAEAPFNILLVAGCKDAQALDRVIDRALTELEGSRTKVEGTASPTFRVRVTKDETAPPLFYSHHEGYVLLGQSPDRLAAAITTSTSSKGLLAAGDFQRVRGKLPEQAVSLGYVNLPRLSGLLRESMLFQMGTAQDEKAKAVSGSLLADEQAPFGLAWSTTETEDGILKSTFGPDTMLGALPVNNGSMSLGIIAAIAVPNLLEAIDRGKQKRTTGDMQLVANALGASAASKGHFAKSPKFVELSSLELSLGELPSTDGWAGPLLYWSNGQRSVLVSQGKDGSPDQDLSRWMKEDAAGGPFSDINADIVFVNGSPATWPGGSQP